MDIGSNIFLMGLEIAAVKAVQIVNTQMVVNRDSAGHRHQVCYLSNVV